MDEKYCPACGGVLHAVPWEDDLTLPVCEVCGYRFYQNSKPCVVAIILDPEQDRILLCRRGIEPYKDCWDLPGGFLRNGEDPVDGVKREVKEELGVEIEIIRLFDILVDTYGREDVFTFNVCYIVRLLTEDIRVGDELARRLPAMPMRCGPCGFYRQQDTRGFNFAVAFEHPIRLEGETTEKRAVWVRANANADPDVSRDQAWQWFSEVSRRFA